MLGTELNLGSQDAKHVRSPPTGPANPIIGTGRLDCPEGPFYLKLDIHGVWHTGIHLRYV